MTSEEIKEAMHNLTPVIYDGIQYTRISAYIYRVVFNKNTGKYKTVYQVELLDKNGNCVVIADPIKVVAIK